MSLRLLKRPPLKSNFDITGAEIINPTAYPEFDAMVAKMVELRKGKMTDEQCRAALSKGNYFGTMLVKMGKADCLLGGATYSTADTVRPALQLIKCKPAHQVRQLLLHPAWQGRQDEKHCHGRLRHQHRLSDIVDKATGEVRSGSRRSWLRPQSTPLQVFGIDPAALLCCPTPPRVPARASTVDTDAQCYRPRRRSAHPELKVDGELQFDAAVSPESSAS